MLKDLVGCYVPNPGVVAVSSVIPMGAALPGHVTFLAGFGAAQPAFFIMADGAGKGLSCLATVNGDNTVTITSILLNHLARNTSGETFSGVCSAWCEVPAGSAPGLVLANSTTAAMRAAMGVPAVPTATGSAIGEWRSINSGSGSALVLPAGGTWAYRYQSINNSSGVLTGVNGASLGAGGATLQAGSAGIVFDGMAWRVA